MIIKRFRLTDTGTKLIVRLALQSGDTLAQSHEWLEAKIELGPEWRSKPLPEIRTEALQRLRSELLNETQRPQSP